MGQQISFLDQMCKGYTEVVSILKLRINVFQEGRWLGGIMCVLESQFLSSSRVSHKRKKVPGSDMCYSLKLLITLETASSV